MAVRVTSLPTSTSVEVGDTVTFSMVPGALAVATVSITGTPTTNPVAGPSTSVTLSSKQAGCLLFQ